MRLVQRFNPRSLSGAPLDLWNRKVRLVYLDEAGVGNLFDEPYLVMAGIILNADQDWRPLQRHIKSLRRKYLPSESRDFFIFHAKDILHGTGYFREHDRRQWPRDKRMQILADLAEIPRLFHLPVAFQAISRSMAAKWFQARHLQRRGWKPTRSSCDPRFGEPKPTPLPDRAIAASTHASAWVECIAKIDLWMKVHAPNEVAMIVAENPGKIQDFLKAIHSGYASDEFYDARAFSTERIVDTVTFAEKRESILLQIADTCAYVIKRKIMGKSEIVPCYDLLAPQLISSLEEESRWL